MLITLLVLAVLLCLMAPPVGGRRGCRVNDLSRWEQYGGTLKRPPPPGPSRIRP